MDARPVSRLDQAAQGRPRRCSPVLRISSCDPWADRGKGCARHHCLLVIPFQPYLADVANIGSHKDTVWRRDHCHRATRRVLRQLLTCSFRVRAARGVHVRSPHTHSPMRACAYASCRGQRTGIAVLRAALTTALAIALADDTVFMERFGYVTPRTLHSLSISPCRVHHLEMTGALIGICFASLHTPPQHLLPLIVVFVLRGRDAFLDEPRLFTRISLEDELATSGLRAWRQTSAVYDIPTSGALKDLLELILGAQVCFYIVANVCHSSLSCIDPRFPRRVERKLPPALGTHDHHPSIHRLY